MIKAGDVVKWRCPLDEDYSCGTVLEIKKSLATVRCSGYYEGFITEVHIKYIRKLSKGGRSSGSNKKHSKRSIT